MIYVQTMKRLQKLESWHPAIIVHPRHLPRLYDKLEEIEPLLSWVGGYELICLLQWLFPVTFDLHTKIEKKNVNKIITKPFPSSATVTKFWSSENRAQKCIFEIRVCACGDLISSILHDKIEAMWVESTGMEGDRNFTSDSQKC